MKAWVNVSEDERLGVRDEGKQREEDNGRLWKTEGAGAVELKDGVTGADEVRWLAGGRCDFDSAAVHTNTKSQGQDG